VLIPTGDAERGDVAGAVLDAEALADPPTFEELPGMWASQEEQLRYMRRVVDHARGMPVIRAAARDIVFRINSCHEYDHRAHAIALGRWVQRHVTYVNELPDVFQTPEVTLIQRYGDCEDKSMLTAALLESVGVVSYLFAIGWSTDPDAPKFEHVYSVAEIPDGDGGTYLLPLDTTLRTDLRKRQRDPYAEMRSQGRTVRVFAV
jgi:transglutaminase-like putative cysteine protease